MNFSLLLPSRNRLPLLKQLCESIQKTTLDLSQIEVLLGYDNDAPINLFYPWLQLHNRERGSNLSRDYFNWLYKKSTGKYIWVLNDDVEIITYGWDKCFFVLEEFGSIVYGWINDSDTMNRFGSYSCFPILGREGIERLGYVLHEYYGGWSADVHLYEVYKLANKVLDLSYIVAKHYTHWLGLREKDELYWSMKQKSINTGMINVSTDAKKLINISLL